MLAARTIPRTAGAAAARAAKPAGLPLLQARRPSVQAKAIDETNFALNLLSSTTAAAVVTAVTVATNENRDKELERLQNVSAAAHASLWDAFGAVQPTPQCLCAHMRITSLACGPQLDTWAIAPIGAAVAVDSIVHSIPGINVLLSLLAEPVGAAAGVAYMMTLVLSAQQVDPKTLAPEVRARV